MKNSLFKIAMVLSIILISFAKLDVSASENENIKYLTVNEYSELLKEYNYLSSLKKVARNTDDIINSKIEDLKTKIDDYPKHIYKLKDKTDAELYLLNYSDEQIGIIRSYDGSFEQTLAVSATVYAQLTLNSFSYSSTANRTYASATFSGYWNGTPFYRGTDNIGVSINGSLSRFAQNGYSAKITHADGTVIYNPSSEYISMVGVRYKFGITDGTGTIFKSFTMTYNAIADGKNTIIDYGAAYAHNITTVTSFSLGLSYGSSVGVGISFSFGNLSSNMWKNVYTRTTYK